MSHYFAYLHVHSYFSRGGGPHSPDDWCRAATELGYRALALTDRGPMVGFPALARAARKAGLVAVYGVEVDVVLPGGGASGRKGGEPVVVPVTLYARDGEGMSNLARLCSLAYGGWPGREEAVAWEALAQRAAGLVMALPGGDEAGALSPFVGFVGKKLGELGGQIKEVFGESAFVGLPHSGRPGDSALAASVMSAAYQMGVPVVAMPSARYIRPEDAPAYEALKVARGRAGWPEASGNGNGFGHTGSTAIDRPGPYWMRSRDDVEELFKEWPSAVENVGRVVELCSSGQWSVVSGQWVGGEDRGARGEGAGIGEWVEGRLVERLGVEGVTEEVRERLRGELEVVERGGAGGAWAGLGALVEAAGKGNVLLGAPLGVADGSLIGFALGVSAGWSVGDGPVLGGAREGVLPLPGVEVPVGRREELLGALAQEFGVGRVALGACCVEITAVAAARAAGSVMGVAGDELKALADGALEKGWEAFAGGEGRGARGEGMGVGEVALALRGAPLGFRRDRDTVVVAPRQVYGEAGIGDWMPLLGRDGGGGRRWVPWGEETLCEMGCPAISVRASAALDGVDVAVELAGRYPAAGFAVGDVKLGAWPQVSEEMTGVIGRGEVAGVPYLAAEVVRGSEGEITPEVVGAWVVRSQKSEVRNQTSEVGSQTLEGVAVWDEVAGESGGEIIYREQFEAILGKVGVGRGEAAGLRRAMLKGEAGARLRFVARLVDGGMAEAQALGLWEALAGAVRGGLVSRGAAMSWGRAAMWGVALKVGHPAAMLAGAITAAWLRGGKGEIGALVKEARRLGVGTRPLDVDICGAGLTLEREGAGWAIAWGLALLPGWNREVAERFVAARPKGGFGGFSEVARAAAGAGVANGQLEALVRAGGCDRSGGREWSREALVEAVGPMMEWARRSNAAGEQRDLFSAVLVDECPVGDDELLEGVGATPGVMFERRAWEEANLGVAFTQAAGMDGLRGALDKSGSLKDKLLSTAQLEGVAEGQSVYLVGLLCSIRMVEGAAGNGGGRMAVACVEDLEGSVELVAFPPNYKRQQEFWVEGSLVVVTGRVQRHADGEVYLLCEHLAPFYAEEEGEMIVTSKTSRKGAAKVAAEGVVAEAEAVAASAAAGAAGKMDAPRSGMGAVPAPVSPAAPPSLPRESEGGGGPGYTLIITLPDVRDDRRAIDAMSDLNGLLRRHPGNDVVRLRIPYSPDTGAVTSATLPWGVRMSGQLEAQIRGLLGPDALAVIRMVG